MKSSGKGASTVCHSLSHPGIPVQNSQAESQVESFVNEKSVTQGFVTESYVTEHAEALLTPLVVLKCLAEDTRLTVVQLLVRMDELCVCELIWLLEQRATLSPPSSLQSPGSISQPKVSRHLAQLRDAGLLTSQRRGQWVHYRLAPDLPSWCHEIFETLCQANAGEVTRWVAWLEAMPNRPERCC